VLTICVITRMFSVENIVHCQDAAFESFAQHGSHTTRTTLDYNARKKIKQSCLTTAGLLYVLLCCTQLLKYNVLPRCMIKTWKLSEWN